MKIAKNRRGYALLMALLVTTTIVAGSAALSRVVLSNLRQSQLVDRAAVAKIAASSGLEKGLFLVRRLERAPGFGAPYFANSDALGAVSISVRLNDDPSVASRFSIPQDAFVALDLPPDALLETIVIPPWTPEDQCPQSWIEVSVSSWDAYGFSVDRKLFSLNDGQAVVSLAAGASFERQVRIKALYCGVRQLTVVGEGAGNAIPLPARVVIDSVGEYLGSRQALRAALPARPPLSGVFDFVLYSSSAINKGN